jgi:hypothetical protein
MVLLLFGKYYQFCTKTMEFSDDEDYHENRGNNEDDFFPNQTYENKGDIVKSVVEYHQLCHRSFGLISSDRRYNQYTNWTTCNSFSKIHICTRFKSHLIEYGAFLEFPLSFSTWYIFGNKKQCGTFLVINNSCGVFLVLTHIIVLNKIDP